MSGRKKAPAKATNVKKPTSKRLSSVQEEEVVLSGSESPSELAETCRRELGITAGERGRTDRRAEGSIELRDRVNPKTATSRKSTSPPAKPTKRKKHSNKVR